MRYAGKVRVPGAFRHTYIGVLGVTASLTDRPFFTSLPPYHSLSNLFTAHDARQTTIFNLIGGWYSVLVSVPSQSNFFRIYKVEVESFWSVG